MFSILLKARKLVTIVFNNTVTMADFISGENCVFLLLFPGLRVRTGHCTATGVSFFHIYLPCWSFPSSPHLRGRVVKGVGHLDHV